MRYFLLSFLLLPCLLPQARGADTLQAPNVVIVTIDGLRWQEVFCGMDETIVSEGSYAAEPELLRLLYGGTGTAERRERLMPFLWRVVAREGQLYGNRQYGNKMDVSNWYKFSYPGYNEMLTGYADSRCIPNTPVANRNTNLLEFLNRQEAYRGKIAAFSSWNIFPYILNERRSGIPVNSGYEASGEADGRVRWIDSAQELVPHKGHTRFDELTYLQAREYMRLHHPKVVLIGFGEADEFAHHGRYDAYLQSIHNTDRMIGELWYYLQTEAFYRNNTLLLLTTDHGRGRKARNWTDHLFLVGGSGEIWMAIMGAGIQPLGEVRQRRKILQKQIAATVAGFLNIRFTCEHPVAEGVDIPRDGPKGNPVWVWRPDQTLPEAALPAALPEKMQPPRKVPSSAR